MDIKDAIATADIGIRLLNAPLHPMEQDMAKEITRKAMQAILVNFGVAPQAMGGNDGKRKAWK